MHTIANILFDFGNVLIDIDIPGAISRMAQLRSPKIDEDDYLEGLTSLVKKYEVGAVSTDLFINGVLRYAHYDVQARDVIEAWNSMLIGIPAYRLTMLRQLRDRFGIYMLSNTNPLHISWVLGHLDEVHGITDFESEYLDEVYYSHEIGARKPDAEAFHHVLDDAMITAGKTLFIDDMEENINAADKVGLKTLHSPVDEEVTETLKVLGYF